MTLPPCLDAWSQSLHDALVRISSATLTLPGLGKGSPLSGNFKEDHLEKRSLRSWSKTTAEPRMRAVDTLHLLVHKNTGARTRHRRSNFSLVTHPLTCPCPSPLTFLFPPPDHFPPPILIS